MKAEILKALKAKFEGVSDAILNRVAEKMAKTVTTETAVAPAVEGVTFQQVLESYADSRATEASQSAIVNYEKKHKLKDGKPEQEGDTGKADDKTPAPQETVPEWAKSLLDANKALQDKIAAIEGEKVTTSRKTQLATAIATAPEKFRSRIEKDFERMNFKSDEEYNAWITEVKTDAETLAQEQATKGASFLRPYGSKTPVDKDEVPKAIQDHFDNEQKKDSQPF